MQVLSNLLDNTIPKEEIVMNKSPSFKDVEMMQTVNEISASKHNHVHIL